MRNAGPNADGENLCRIRTCVTVPPRSIPKFDRKFEVITVAYHDFAVSNASTRMLLDAGVPNIHRHIESLVDRVIEWAVSRNDVHIVTPVDAARRAGVFSFQPKDIEAAGAPLKRGGVTFVQRESAIRLAPHAYNTMEEMDCVVALLTAEPAA